MIRQETPPDPALMFPPLRGPRVPPAEVIPPHVKTTKGGLAVEQEPAAVPEVVRAGTPEAAPQTPGGRDTVLWTPPVPTFTYLAGAAGSGKTFATQAWAAREKGLLLCATTGIAAVNLGGETVNSVLGYYDTDSLHEKYLSGSLTAQLGRLWVAGVRRLVLDEVSMLASDQLTYLVKAVEEVNGRGYVLGKWTEEDDSPPPEMGLTLVGDFLQLPPVKAHFAFKSPEWKRFTPHTLTLTKCWRQADPDFIEALRAARRGDGQVVVDYFAGRGELHHETHNQYDGPTILAKNEAVDRYNYLRMADLPGKEIGVASSRWGKQRSEWEKYVPQELRLKLGALVMVLANYRDKTGLRYVNGDLGTIVDVSRTSAWVELQRTGETVEIFSVVRDVRTPADSKRRKALREEGLEDRILDNKWEVLGEICYLPLRVAYASTVHKSQGLSLDKVQVNIRDGFFKTPGMVYVALSRARTAAGLRLVGSPQEVVDRCRSNPKLREWL